jgi:dsRNA-specific ribonuclease
VPHCAACPSTTVHRSGSPQRFVTDERLARSAASAGLGAWLEWDAGPDRRADLVEACVAVAWIAGGWSRATDVVRRIVHPVGAQTASVLEGGAATAGTSPPDARAARRLGAALLELTAAQLVFTADPAADEGQLSVRRAALHRASVIAARARDQHLVDGGGPDTAVSDRVEALLAERLLAVGADAALAEARALFAAPRSSG